MGDDRIIQIRVLIAAGIGCGRDALQAFAI